jgi:hypothetical protein
VQLQRALLSAVLLTAGLHTHSARADALRQIERTAADDGGGEDNADAADSTSDSGGSRSGLEADCFGQECDRGPESLTLSHMFGQMALHIVGFPWILPYYMLDDPCLDAYAEHPYQAGSGLALSSRCGDQAAPSARNVLFEVGLESGYMLQQVVPTTAGVRLQLPLRLELDSRVTLLRDFAEQTAEHALSMNSHVAYRFARGRRADFRTGVGVRLYVFDKTLAGVDLLYAIDSYLGRGVVARIELHAGTLGRAFLAQARATLGVMVERFELYAGYDHMVVAGEGTARLGGAVAGVRSWF